MGSSRRILSERSGRVAGGSSDHAHLRQRDAQLAQQRSRVPHVPEVGQPLALDPEIALLETERGQARLRNYRQAGRLLAKRGDLREGLTPEAAAAIIFSLGHPESRRLLVLRSGWSTDRWAAWVTDALVAALLRDA
jgi:hypothetical protein